jgi:hypothetical protein
MAVEDRTMEAGRGGVAKIGKSTAVASAVAV